MLRLLIFDNPRDAYDLAEGVEVLAGDCTAVMVVKLIENLKLNETSLFLNHVLQYVESRC